MPKVRDDDRFKLSGEQVRRLRTQLDLTQVGLADVVNVSLDTIKTWEKKASEKPNSGGCGGSSGKLLSVLRDHHGLLPFFRGQESDQVGFDLDALESTPEWHKVQAVLACLNRCSHGVDEFAKIQAIFGLTDDHLDQLKNARLIKKDRPQPGCYVTTPRAERKYKLELARFAFGRRKEAWVHPPTAPTPVTLADYEVPLSSADQARAAKEYATALAEEEHSESRTAIKDNAETSAAGAARRRG